MRLSRVIGRVSIDRNSDLVENLEAERPAIQERLTQLAKAFQGSSVDQIHAGVAEDRLLIEVAGSLLLRLGSPDQRKQGRKAVRRTVARFVQTDVLGYEPDDRQPNQVSAAG